MLESFLRPPSALSLGTVRSKDQLNNGLLCLFARLPPTIRGTSAVVGCKRPTMRILGWSTSKPCVYLTAAARSTIFAMHDCSRTRFVGALRTALGGCHHLVGQEKSSRQNRTTSGCQSAAERRSSVARACFCRSDIRGNLMNWHLRFAHDLYSLQRAPPWNSLSFSPPDFTSIPFPLAGGHTDLGRFVVLCTL
ncbi:hypothetical protein PYCCODRAFT_444299 [Trametes coccinea BRFM310]|uniref:Uncharacterized protein n=1 Tax=Trametes coccinea (strain BRFM310) TaxID=1353009 RepID=A0A1Y2IPI1_TRAC3|nr:hypothetical protein PYCCODRAFT_444299 [Trametes coccinea BRFM310]